jgi:hypothetical protein
MNWRLLDPTNPQRHLFFGGTLKGMNGLQPHIIGDLVQFWLKLFEIVDNYVSTSDMAANVLICAGRNWGGELVARPALGVKMKRELPPFKLQMDLGLLAEDEILGEVEIAKRCRQQGTEILFYLGEALKSGDLWNHSLKLPGDLHLLAMNYYQRNPVYNVLLKDRKLQAAGPATEMFSIFDHE